MEAKPLSLEHCGGVFSELWPDDSVEVTGREKLEQKFEVPMTPDEVSPSGSVVYKFDLVRTPPSGEPQNLSVVGKTYSQDSPQVVYNEVQGLGCAWHGYAAAIGSDGLEIQLFGKKGRRANTFNLTAPPVPKPYKHDLETNTYFRGFVEGEPLRLVLNNINERLNGDSRDRPEGFRRSILRQNLRNLQRALVYSVSAFHQVTFPLIPDSQISRPGNVRFVDCFVNWLELAAQRNDPGFEMSNATDGKIRAHLQESRLARYLTSEDYDYMLAGDQHTNNWLLDTRGWGDFYEQIGSEPIPIETFLERIRLYDLGKARIASATIDIGNITTYPGFRNSGRSVDELRQQYLKSDNLWLPPFLEARPEFNGGKHRRFMGANGRYTNKERNRFTEMCILYGDFMDNLKQAVRDPNDKNRAIYLRQFASALRRQSRKDERAKALSQIIHQEIPLFSR